MRSRSRQIIRLPLAELWDDFGSFGVRIRELSKADLRGLMAPTPFRFVEADLGSRLKWFMSVEWFNYWRTEQAHIAEDPHFHLEDYPANRVLVASEWEGRLGEKLVLLEVHH